MKIITNTFKTMRVMIKGEAFVSMAFERMSIGAMTIGMRMMCISKRVLSFVDLDWLLVFGSNSCFHELIDDIHPRFQRFRSTRYGLLWVMGGCPNDRSDLRVHPS